MQAKASKKVNFQDIVKLEILSDDEQIVLVSLRSRTMRLAVNDSVAFVCAIQRNMKVRTFLFAPWEYVHGGGQSFKKDFIYVYGFFVVKAEDCRVINFQS